MIIPAGWTDTISNVFYDKTIDLYNLSSVTDTDGFTRFQLSSVNKTFEANINFSELDKIQRDYGIDSKISSTITTNENIPEASIIGYNGKYHRIIRNIKFDSHYFLITEEWL